MGFLDSLFGSKDEQPSPHREAPQASSGRAYDIIDSALSAWNKGDNDRAETLFKKGIAAYHAQEPEGQDFALGRYGAFLLDQGRKEDAKRILEEAINLKSSIPAIWSDYIQILNQEGNLQVFKHAVDRMAASTRSPVDPEFLMAQARVALRNGSSGFAEQIARWVVERAEAAGDKKAVWAAVGDLGQILEKAERLEEALKLWKDSFADGSNDATTSDRLSLNLERAKDYAGAVSVIETALKRGLPANVEESLRKRLARCESKKSGRKPVKGKVREEIAAYSIRYGEDAFDPLFQIRLKPGISDLDLWGANARCMLTSKESTSLVDIDVATGAEVNRIEGLPKLDDLQFASNGFGIGLKRTAAVGKGATALVFLDDNGRVIEETTVPDATSEIALGPDLWYVGCRDGNLYAFNLNGKRLWIWETPGAKNSQNNVYFRPCPYYVSSQASFAVVSSMGNIYAINSNGRMRWHKKIPNEVQTKWTYTIPISGIDGKDPYEVLKISPTATPLEVKTAYRRLALATHPDRNLLDPSATEKFREVQSAYEHILSGTTVGPKGKVKINIEIRGMDPMVSFIASNAEGVVAGSSQGRLYLFNSEGEIQEARALGEGQIHAALRPDGSLGAAWCDNTLMFFKEGRISNAIEVSEYPAKLFMIGDEVIIVRRNQVSVMDDLGRPVWTVEFSKSITDIAVHGDTLICAAGVLAGFRRRR